MAERRRRRGVEEDLEVVVVLREGDEPQRRRLLPLRKVHRVSLGECGLDLHHRLGAILEEVVDLAAVDADDAEHELAGEAQRQGRVGVDDGLCAGSMEGSGGLGGQRGIVGKLLENQIAKKESQTARPGGGFPQRVPGDCAGRGVEQGGRRWAMGSDSARGPFARFPGFRAVETPASRVPRAPGESALATERDEFLAGEAKEFREGRWTGDSRTASAMSVSVICCFRSLACRCAAIQIVPSGPRLADVLRVNILSPSQTSFQTESAPSVPATPMTVPRSDATLRCLAAGAATELVALAVARVSRVLTGLRRVVVVADNDNIGSKALQNQFRAHNHKT